jgi:hypothetical protein
MNGQRALFDRQAKWAFLVACLVLIGSSLTFDWAVRAFNVFLRKEAVEMRGAFGTIPKIIGDWKAIGEDHPMPVEMIEELGTDKYLDRAYGRTGKTSNELFQLHLAYYTGMIDTVPHVPDRCLVAAGFNLKKQPENLELKIDRANWWVDPEFTNLASGNSYWLAGAPDAFTGKIQPVRMPVGDFYLRTTEFEDPEQPNVRIFAGYFFVANGRSVSTPTEVKAFAFDPRERFAYYCKVQFTYGGNGATQEKFVAIVSDFLKDFLPELMQRLPDWAEVERRGSPVKTETPSPRKDESY